MVYCVRTKPHNCGKIKEILFQEYLLPTFAPAMTPTAFLIQALSKLPSHTGAVILQSEPTLVSDGKSKKYIALLVPGLINSTYTEM
jgi:hypothetical protein